MNEDDKKRHAAFVIKNAVGDYSGNSEGINAQKSAASAGNTPQADSIVQQAQGLSAGNAVNQAAAQQQTQQKNSPEVRSVINAEKKDAAPKIEVRQAMQAGTSAQKTAVGKEDEEESEALKNALKEVEKMKTTVASVKNDVDKMNKKFSELEDTIASLASVYEIVTNQINPFIGGTGKNNQSFPLPNSKVCGGVDKSLAGAATLRENSGTRLDVQSEDEARQSKRTEQANAGSDYGQEENGMGNSGNIDSSAGKTPENRVPAQRASAQGSRSGRGSGKAILERLDTGNIEAVECVVEWLEFLIKKAGHKNLSRILEYYRNINWISNSVKDMLEDYASGISVEGEPESEGMKGLSGETQKQSLEHLYKIVGELEE